MRRLPFEALVGEANAKYDVLKSVPPHYLSEAGLTALEAWRHIINAQIFAESVEELVEILEDHVTKIDDTAVKTKLVAYINSLDTSEK